MRRVRYYPRTNPRTQSWWDHFAWADDGIRISGTTPSGRATVAALHLSDDSDALAVCSYWVLAGSGIHRGMTGLSQ